IQHGLADAVGGEVAETVKIRLIFKFKGPSHCSFKVHLVARGQIIFAGKRCRRVAGIHGSVAIAVLAMKPDGTSRTTLRVRLTDEDRQPLQLGEGRHNFKTSGDTAQLRSEEHTSELQSRVDIVCRLLLEK